VDVYTFNPLSDLRWHELVVKHPKASVFHQCGWVRALATTYGYEPLVLTTSPSDQPLSNGVVFCRVSSWITGSRLVSLPFSDHCDPLVDEHAEHVLIGRLRQMSEQQNYKYLEIRPLGSIDGEKVGMTESSTFCFHMLDLRDDLQAIFRRLHKDSIQRKIHRAQREGLVCEVGNSDRLVNEFYRLLIKTRKRHRMLPQPLAWIKNLVAFMGDTLQIRVARQSGTPVAAMLSLKHRKTVVYKYGCSDERKHNLGSVPFLFWNLIQESKVQGAEQLDLGRSDWDQPSLILFKDRLGASKRSLSYLRSKDSSKATRITAFASHIPHAGFSILPDGILSAAGRLAYRHLG
jgi:hypothetical protein